MSTSLNFTSYTASDTSITKKVFHNFYFLQMPVFKGKDGTGKEKTFVREEGYTWPIKAVERFMKNDLKKRLEEIKYFDVRSDDILVCAYMKSGTIGLIPDNYRHSDGN